MVSTLTRSVSTASNPAPSAPVPTAEPAPTSAPTLAQPLPTMPVYGTTATTPAVAPYSPPSPYAPAVKPTMGAGSDAGYIDGHGVVGQFAAPMPVQAPAPQGDMKKLLFVGALVVGAYLLTR